MGEGKFPKAYLRISPDLDQHEDPEAMVLLICAANRQQPRGRFKSRAVLERVIGKSRFVKCVARRDLVQIANGGWYLDGWDEWQEGDHTVGERMRRLRGRARTRNGVTPELRNGDAATVTVLPQASGVRRQASGASSLKTGTPRQIGARVVELVADLRVDA